MTTSSSDDGSRRSGAGRGPDPGPNDGRGPRRGSSPCQGCRHLYSTWKPPRPRGCRAYGFESVAWPADVVLESSGAPCQLFEPRPGSHGARGGSPRGGRHEGGLYG